MEKYAVVEIGGKQYKVGEGREIKVERLGVSDGPIVFDKVLLLAGQGEIKIGTPYLPGVRVVAKVMGEEKGDKIRVVKFKAKSRYRRTTGFRAKLTRVKIEIIGGDTISIGKKSLPKIVKPSVPKTPKKK